MKVPVVIVPDSSLGQVTPDLQVEQTAQSITFHLAPPMRKREKPFRKLSGVRCTLIPRSRPEPTLSLFSGYFRLAGRILLLEPTLIDAGVLSGEG